MREIKFRALDIIDEKIKNVECIFCDHKGNIEKVELSELLGDEYGYTEGYPETEGFPEDVILMQYTGLKDKNGKEIYEGDVVKCYDDIWQIIWDEEQACFTMESIGETIIVISRLRRGSDCVVIGNIYENPELLKEE